jgi:hypothetical protein
MSANNGWQKFLKLVNSNEIGHVFTRTELLAFADVNGMASGSIDGYRNQMVQGGYFKRIRRGTYRLDNKLPDGTTTTEMYHLRNNDRLKYLEKVVGRKERTQRQAEEKARQEAAYSTNTRIIADAKSRPCLDCKVSFPSVVMQFSYRQVPRWHRSLTKMILGNTQKLVDEIADCDVVCMNCHIIRRGISCLQ